MVLIALGIIIAVAQAAEPTGTLTLACKGTKSETTPRIAEAGQSSISVDIIIDFGARTITGFPLPPVCELDRPAIREITETTIFFTGCSPIDLTVSYSFLGTFNRETRAMEAGFIGTGDSGTLAEMQADPLKCKPTQRMF
jgi:hypothetical protein